MTAQWWAIVADVAFMVGLYPMGVFADRVRERMRRRKPWGQR